MPSHHTAIDDAPGFATRQLHAGGDPAAPVRSRTTPIYLSAGFPFDDFDSSAEHFGGGDGYSYTRVANPTTAAVERRIAALEGGAEAVLVGSGQAAVAITLLGLVGTGQRVLAASSLYEGTRGLLLDNLPRLGIDADWVDDTNDAEAWRRAIRPTTRALFVESIANPRNEIVDLAALAAVAHEHGLPLVVDNTLASPYLLRPIEHGADVVVHSASKFLAGHGAVLGGAIVDNGRFDPQRSASLFPHLVAPDRLGRPLPQARAEGLARIRHLRDVVALRFGPTPSPLNAFLIEQGIETLSLLSVDYSGLRSSPYHELALRYLPVGQGSVFSFTLRGGLEAARRFVDGLRLFTRMTHLGDVRSLVLHLTSTSHTLRTDEELSQAGIWPGTLRLSIGIEHAPDLIRDLRRGIEAVRAG
jgi:O-acetylhomoserine (thiol)-lyase